MTLEELRLRIEAAFPTADLRTCERNDEAHASFVDPLDLDCGALPISGFEAILDEGVELEIYVGFPFDHTAEDIEDVPVKGDWDLAEVAIRQRLSSVTAHQLIAARRRLAGASA